MLRFALILLVCCSTCSAAERQINDYKPYQHYQQAKNFADSGSWQQAVSHYQKAQQLANARIDLSLYQLRGIGGLQQNLSAVQQTLTKEAELGSARAMLILSNLFQRGIFGWPIDHTKAQYYRLNYQKISQQRQQNKLANLPVSGVDLAFDNNSNI
ncbi:hypothetical protein GCM10011369_08540 [Neiella marina]|uniref:Tetratricopeptide repeat protein n=1 Tax=Neiella marina TaxID=508461 RepID=A0A8J2U3B4_9GAMM|nr:hypothetical protein [Neiella marina]GGA69188.1 hypothetical protein GCM10011369_08540 [Neiella marina]